MTKKHWMPLYTSDYLADTMHLSGVEHGGYFLMLIHAWHNEGVLPKDEDRLRRIAKMDAKQWKESGGVLMDFLYDAGDGYRQKRMDAELKNANDNIDKRSAAGKIAGKISGEKRRAKKNESLNDDERIVDESLNDYPTNDATKSQPKRTPSPSPSIVLEDKSSNTTQPRAPETDFGKVFDAGIEVFPNLQAKNTSAIHGWLAKGASPDMDIIPIIQGFAGRSIATWTYFTAAIEQAVSNRMAGLPPPVASKPNQSNPQTFTPRKQPTKEQRIMHLAEFRDRVGLETMPFNERRELDEWEAAHGKIDWKKAKGATQ